MEAIRKELETRTAACLERLAEETKSGKPLIAYTSTFLPAELIRAAGANVYYLCHGGDAGPVDAAADYTLNCINPLARACVGYVVCGIDPLASRADLLVTAFADNHMGRMSELLEYNQIPVCKVGIPTNWHSEIARNYYRDALKRMMERVGTVTGQAADPELARTFFAQSNRIHQALRRINELRRQNTVPIGIEEVLRLHHASFLFRGEEELQWLEQLPDALSQTEPPFPEDAPRLLLAGRVAAVGDYEIPRMLDKSGCPVVAEMLDEGVRVLDGDMPLEGDLLEQFAALPFSGRLPIGTFQPSWKLRFQHLRRLLEEYRVDGVIWYQLANDEIYDMEYTCYAKWLKELGMPLVRLETDFCYTPEKTAVREKTLNSFLKAARKHRHS